MSKYMENNKAGKPCHSVCPREYDPDKKFQRRNQEQCLMLIVLATWEVEIGRVAV
jgi:hypothetical protein